MYSISLHRLQKERFKQQMPMSNVRAQPSPIVAYTGGRVKAQKAPNGNQCIFLKKPKQTKKQNRFCLQTYTDYPGSLLPGSVRTQIIQFKYKSVVLITCISNLVLFITFNWNLNLKFSVHFVFLTSFFLYISIYCVRGPLSPPFIHVLPMVMGAELR